ncbi:unnamed protein product, partial [Polarella glacialis]
EKSFDSYWTPLFGDGSHAGQMCQGDVDWIEPVEDHMRRYRMTYSGLRLVIRQAKAAPSFAGAKQLVRANPTWPMTGPPSSIIRSQVASQPCATPRGGSHVPAAPHHFQRPQHVVVPYGHFAPGHSVVTRMSPGHGAVLAAPGQ